MAIHSLQLEFMQKQIQGLDDNQRMVMCPSARGDEVDHNIRAGAASVGLIDHGLRQIYENNKVRQELLEACKRELGVTRFVDLPQKVREAFKVGTFKDDLKLEVINGQEKVTSGRPLTARRIRQVIQAVSDSVNLAKGEHKAWLDYCADRVRHQHEPDHEVYNYFVDQAKRVPADTLKLFDNGVDAQSFRAFAKALYHHECAFTPRMPQNVANAADGGDGSIFRHMFLDVVVGRLSDRSRRALARFINTPACMDAIHADYNLLNSNTLPDQEEHELNGALAFEGHIRQAVAGYEDFTALDL